jgi:hypothetical protein
VLGGEPSELNLIGLGIGGEPSEDGKVLAAMCSAPVPLLWAWHIPSRALVARCALPTPFTSLSCRPGSGSQWAACGLSGVRVWDLAVDEGEFREVPWNVQVRPFSVSLVSLVCRGFVRIVLAFLCWPTILPMHSSDGHVVAGCSVDLLSI